MNRFSPASFNWYIFVKSRIYIILILCLVPLCSIAQDPFQSYLTGKPPVITEDLGTETTAEGLKIHRLIFRSRMLETTAGNQPCLVFAAIVHPAGRGKHPGIVRLHGGGGSADIPAAITSAKAGYVSLVLDIPAVAGKAQHPKNNFPAASRPKIGARPDATYSGLFDAVLAAIQSFYLLRAQPDVDPKRIGIAGASWGGYTATMVAGILNKDIACTYSAYGSGNFLKGAYEKTHIEQLPEKERSAWLTYMDPGNRARNITKPFIIATASNDRHWSWMAVQATLADMKGPTYQFYSPNDNHMMKYPGSNLMIPFFNHYLLGGPALPAITAIKYTTTTAGGLKISFKVKHTQNPIAVRVFYTNPEEQVLWTERKWSFIDAVPLAAGYQAIIPAEANAKALDCYVLLTDVQPRLGADTVSVSSLIRQTHSVTGERKSKINAKKNPSARNINFSGQAQH